jgi:hypothetical protein
MGRLHSSLLQNLYDYFSLEGSKVQAKTMSIILGRENAPEIFLLWFGNWPIMLSCLWVAGFRISGK